MNLPLFKTLRLRWLAALIGGLIFLDLLSFLLAEGLWFEEVGYSPVFAARLIVQGALGLGIFSLSLGFLGINLAIAYRHDRAQLTSDNPRGIKLAWLLPLTLLLSLLMGLLVLHHGQIALSHWHPSLVPRTTPVLPPRPFNPIVVFQSLWRQQIGQPIALLIGVALLPIYPRRMLGTIALFMSLAFSLIASERWSTLLLALSPTAFNATDPLFNTDIGFYIFSLPIWELLRFWLIGLVALTLLSVGLLYMLSADSLSQGYFPGFSSAQQRHLYALGGLMLLVISLSYWLDRYNLLYSSEGATYGASYTSLSTELPIYTMLSGLAGLLGILLLGRSVYHHKIQLPQSLKLQSPELINSAASSRSSHVLFSRTFRKPPERKPAPPRLSPSFPLLPSVIVLFTLIAAIATYAIPAVVQRLIVQPNELRLERPYIQRTIALTREAFNLNQIEVETFNPNNSLTYADLQKNSQTVGNIRLWDQRPLLETNRQLQRIRSYYEFPNADIDRYTVVSKTGVAAQQQVLIAARELDYSAVPTAAQTWVNEHLIYTHGYGFTVSPVNVVGEGGLPDYLIQGIEPMIVDSQVSNTIPIGKPRIYYGELTDTHVMTQTQVKELDYPSGSDNVYNVYDGRGGVAIGSFWRRLLFAKHLRDWRMVLADNFTPQTHLLFRRRIADRVSAIAPFLRFDSDPYLVVVDTQGKTWQRNSDRASRLSPDQSYLYWVMDAYTVSDRYPYSDPLANDFNYIRNSVKVVIDAYHGSINFYVADAQDPIIRSWQRVFPDMFQSIDQMPSALRQHVRYAQELYRVQTAQLMDYHMTDPIVFYNREDQWRAPNEIYGNQQQVVEPYFLITKLPTGDREEFILLRPFTPTLRNNLIAWMAARSDGEQYGKMLLYVFPKQELVFGPEQIEARINQDPLISERISLWNRQGSRATQGNLLVVPIEQSLLYVEPLYLEAEKNQLPTLVQVIVAYGNRIAMTESLERSLKAVFQAPLRGRPIIRPLEPES